MASLSYRELAKRLREAGCYPVRPGKGGHEIWRNPATGKSFTVPRPLKGEGTLRAILRQAGIDRP